MNQSWVNSLAFHHKRLYPGQPTIDIDQLSRAMEQVEDQEKNGFASYCSKNKSDQNNNPEDIVSFEEFISRIEATYKDTKDTIYTEAFFKLIDADGDGVISHDDLESMNPELGVVSCMNQKDFDILADNLNHQTAQIGKPEFIEIIRQYI